MVIKPTEGELRRSVQLNSRAVRLYWLEAILVALARHTEFGPADSVDARDGVEVGLRYRVVVGVECTDRNIDPGNGLRGEVIEHLFEPVAQNERRNNKADAKHDGEGGKA